MIDSRRHSLLTLPAEICLTVYRNLLQSRFTLFLGPGSKSFHPLSKVPENDLPDLKLDPSPTSSEQRELVPACSSLAKTCRSLRQEVDVLIYNDRLLLTFEHVEKDSAKRLEAFTRPLIREVCLGTGDSAITAAGRVDSLRYTGQLLAGLPGLCTLWVRCKVQSDTRNSIYGECLRFWYTVRHDSLSAKERRLADFDVETLQWLAYIQSSCPQLSFVSYLDDQPFRANLIRSSTEPETQSNRSRFSPKDYYRQLGAVKFQIFWVQQYRPNRIAKALHSGSNRSHPQR